MAGSVDQVDDVRVGVVAKRIGLVFKLKGRGCDRDTAILLHIHPVGDGGFTASFAVHGAGFVDDVGVQCERLRQGGFTGIGVGDDGECPSAASFVGHRAHLGPSFPLAKGGWLNMCTFRRSRQAASATRRRFSREWRFERWPDLRWPTAPPHRQPRQGARARRQIQL